MLLHQFTFENGGLSQFLELYFLNKLILEDSDMVQVQLQFRLKNRFDFLSSNAKPVIHTEMRYDY